MGTIVMLATALSSIGWGQAQDKSYAQLLREALESGPKYEGVPTNIVDRSCAVPQAPFFLPAPAFRDRTAVSYLIAVLENGEHWTDLSVNRQAYYNQQARCYAALSLGYLKDRRAFDLLVAALDSPPDTAATAIGMSGAYDLRCAAAYGVAILGDANAIDPLIAALERKQDDERKTDYAGCLASFRDLRALEPIVRFAVEVVTDATIANSLEYLLRTEFFREFQEHGDGTYSYSCFPELGKQGYFQIHQALWRHWLNGGGQKYAKEQFDEYYKQFKALKPEESEKRDDLIYKMTRGGILALPYVMEKIEAGEDGFEYALHLLTVPKMVRNEKGFTEPMPNPYKEYFTSRTRTLNWWHAEKGKWLIDVGQMRTRIQGAKVAPNVPSTAGGRPIENTKGQ